MVTDISHESSVFWDIMPCSLLKVSRRFGATCHHHSHCWNQARTTDVSEEHAATILRAETKQEQPMFRMNMMPPFSGLEPSTNEHETGSKQDKKQSSVCCLVRP
jgi:hypothetical protein